MSRKRPESLKSTPAGDSVPEDGESTPDTPVKRIMAEVRKAGRPSKITPALIEKIVTYVMDGNYVETACAIAGVCKKTFYEWLKRGRDSPKSLYGQFLHAIEKAAAWSEARDLNAIGAAGKTNWQARAWRLERRFPERYGRFIKVRGELLGADVGDALSEEDRSRIANELAGFFSERL